MIRITFTVIAFALSAATFVAVAKPTRPMPPPAKKAEPPKFVPPNLNGDTNWGRVDQEPGSRDFTLRGHHVWEADCRIRDGDNRVVVMWRNITTNEYAPGVYDLGKDEFGNPELRGEWGYLLNTKIGDDGKLVGEVRGDRVYRVEPALPDI